MGEVSTHASTSLSDQEYMGSYKGLSSQSGKKGQKFNYTYPNTNSQEKSFSVGFENSGEKGQMYIFQETLTDGSVRYW